MLGDEVWRLKKIGKDGLLHKKLASAGVNTVQLLENIVDPGKLRRILGSGMSEKMWNVTIKHAKTCVMGNKHYVFRGSNYRILLNPICQLMKAEINDSIYPTHNLSDINRAYLEILVRQAYVNWSSLEEMEGISNEIGLSHNNIMAEKTRANVMNTIPSTLPAMPPPGPGLMRPAKLPDHPVLVDNFNVLPSPTTGECAVQSLNQKSNAGNDQQRISQEDKNSSNVCYASPPSPSNSSTMKSQLSAAALPALRLQAQSFEELAEQNQSKGNLQSQACCYKQDSDLVNSGKPADAYTWKCYGTQGLIGNRRLSFYRCAHPGCQAKKSVEISLDGQITEVIHRASHNHPESQPTRTSSLSAFSHIIRASYHLTIKIPDKSFVTYENGQMDRAGLVFFMGLVEDENGLQNLMDTNFYQPSYRRKAAIDVDVRKAKKRMRGILRKKVWDANLKEISGNYIPA